MLWTGWIWDTRRQRWEKVCQAEGLGGCARKLGEIASIRKIKDRYTMMTTGGVPAVRLEGRKKKPARTYEQRGELDAPAHSSDGI